MENAGPFSPTAQNRAALSINYSLSGQRHSVLEMLCRITKCEKKKNAEIERTREEMRYKASRVAPYYVAV